MANENSENFDPLVDEKPSRYVVGIDLGTTNSAVTFIDTTKSNWKIEVLSIPQLVAVGETESLDTLPSFYFQPIRTSAENETAGLKMAWDKKSPKFCVGAFARDETAKTSGRGISSAKSWLCHTAVDRTAALLPWHSANDVQKLSPVEVSGQYLRHIRKAWDQKFKNEPLADQDIVLTLPASFDEVARELTVEAAAIAGLKRVVLIEEPQAAFYAWVYKHASDCESRVEVGQKILVCDIGGGTTDFTLIRVRKSSPDSELENSDSDAVKSDSKKIQFHRVAVGNHLILGGDNLDLAIAKYLEQKLTSGGKLEAFQWDVLVGTSRNVKEQMLSDGGAESVTVSLPGRGSKLIGASLKTEVTRDEIRQLILDGFLPDVSVTTKPQHHGSGFQEFGLPYATDAGITKYLAEFLVTHAEAGEMVADEKSSDGDTNALPSTHPARPDVVLFNGGFFASPVLRTTVMERISKWFSNSDESWNPILLENDRLDLAVARGAAYYGIVRRDQGVRIAASLARSYYIGIGNGEAICIVPGNAEPGQKFELEDRTFSLTISQPVEFQLYVSSIRLADQAGQILKIDNDQMSSLPPIRTVLRAKSRNEKRDVSVRLRVGLTEIGTIDLSSHEVNTDRSWKLQFDIRSTTQTDVDVHDAVGESQGFVDEGIWADSQTHIDSVFSESGTASPKELVKQLASTMDSERGDWPMSYLRRIWEALIESGALRKKSSQHESRWLNLLGYALRPGYGVALDDWRVTETWRTVGGNFANVAPNIRNEALILWRRLAGGLSRGQQSAIAEPLLSSIRAMAKQMSGQRVKGNAIPFRPEETVEVWRLLGSLELLSGQIKIELGDFITMFIDKPKLKVARNAMVWAIGRLGQRTPIYGPLNTVVGIDQVSKWIHALLQQNDPDPIEHLAITQMARRTDDRYRDISREQRADVIDWLASHDAAERLVSIVRDGGKFDAEEQGRVFGEALPQGLRLE